ncbi:MAG: terpene cyclase/mutase family protein [Acidobacteriota bacterium]|nr:terpene cyclase/mutase family protein [Acidobacteriota bacterium]
MAEADELQRELLSRQNGDGGWGYQNATSWTEPTALALLALEASDASGTAHERGCRWLLRHQRIDGGWPPNPTVGISTSVTSFASLALSTAFHSSAPYHGALHWIVSQIKPDLGPIGKLEFWLGSLPAVEATAGGSPWFPGTAAWVAPTCMAILALSAAVRLGNRPILQKEVARAQQYLLSRRCFDAGWNHGGTQFRSERAESYPETTGMALVALQGFPSAELTRSLEAAQNMQQSPGSSEAQSWLHLASLRHGQKPATPGLDLPWRTTRDLALRLLALTAANPANRLRVIAA